MRYRVAALVAREHGLNGLEALINSEDYECVLIATHRLLPVTREERSDYSAFVQLAERHGIPIKPVDTRGENAELGEMLQELKPDCLAAISWRRFIPREMREYARFGGVNLHRGKLPDYAGAEPVRRALEKGENSIVIAAHVIEEEIDGGEVLAEANYRIRERNVEAIKSEITPLFGPLLIKSLDLLVQRD